MAAEIRITKTRRGEALSAWRDQTRLSDRQNAEQGLEAFASHVGAPAGP